MIGPNNIGERLPELYGGRALRRYPEFKAPRLDRALSTPVAGPIGWWDPSYLPSLTVSSAGKVTALADRSSSGFNGTVPGSTAWTAVIPDRHRGRAVLLGDLMEVTNGLSASDRTQTVFWAGMVADFTTARCLFGASNTGGRLFRVETTGRLSCVKRATSNLAVASAALTITAGTPFVACLILSDTEIVLRLNRIAAETFAEATTFTASRTTSLNGGDSVLGGRPPGWCCEALAYDGAMSSADADLVIDYLMAKWEIG